MLSHQLTAPCLHIARTAVAAAYLRQYALYPCLSAGANKQSCICSCNQVSEVITTGYKWLRAVCQGEFTGVHTDKVFLGRGSPRVLTAWVPLGQVHQLLPQVSNCLTYALLAHVRCH